MAPPKNNPARIILLVILLACAWILLGVALALPTGCVTDGKFSLWGARGDQKPEVNAKNSNVLVLQWAAGGSGGLTLWSIFLWRRGRVVPTRAADRMVEAIETHDTTKNIRTVIYRNRDVGHDAAEDFISKRVKALSRSNKLS